MFGTFRLMLALMVVWHHMFIQEFAGPIAVFGFFCLSGFLMTKVVNEIYADGIAGFGRYLANRAIRIYPTYWCALVVALVVLSVLPEYVLEERLKSFRNAGSWSEIFIWGHMTFKPALIPQAWSLGIELVYYVAIGAVLGRHRWIASAWFAASLLIVLGGALIGLPFTWFYYSVEASSLPFATGAMIYHFGQPLARLPLPSPIIAVCLLATAGLTMPGEIGAAGGLYFGLMLAAIAVAALARHTPGRLDGLLGALAYPVFLLHITAGALAMSVFDRRAAIAVTAAVLSIIAGAAIVVGVERPLSALRTRLRAAGEPNSTIASSA